MSKKSAIFNVIFEAALLTLPGAAGQSIKAIKDTLVRQPEAAGVVTDGQKRAAAVTRVLASESIAILNSLAGPDGPLKGNPKMEAILSRLNDAIYQAAKEIALLADATDGTVDGTIGDGTGVR